MSTKTAKLARKVKRIAGGEPHTRRQRTQIKRSLRALNHRERGVRQGHWRDLIRGDRERTEAAIRIVGDVGAPDLDQTVAILKAHQEKLP